MHLMEVSFGTPPFVSFHCRGLGSGGSSIDGRRETEKLLNLKISLQCKASSFNFPYDPLPVKRSLTQSIQLPRTMCPLCGFSETLFSVAEGITSLEPS